MVLYERINLSVPVGGPTAPGYATKCFNLSGRCGSSYGDRQRNSTVIPNPQVHCVHQRLGKCALLRGQCIHKSQMGQHLYYCLCFLSPYNNILLLSGKICLFILENTNFTNNTNSCGVLSLLIAYELHEYHPDGIRVIRL